MKKISVVILKRENKILLHLRDNKPGIAYPNHWSLIGGNVESYETPLEAMKREIKEELGININNLKYFGKIKLPIDEFSGRKCLVFFYKTNTPIEIKEINLTEGQRIEYFKIDELRKIKMSKNLKDFLTKNKGVFD